MAAEASLNGDQRAFEQSCMLQCCQLDSMGGHRTRVNNIQIETEHRKGVERREGEARLNEKIVARCIFICVITLAHFQTTISACWQLWPGGRDSFTERAKVFNCCSDVDAAVGGGWAVGGWCRWAALVGLRRVSGWSCRWRRV